MIIKYKSDIISHFINTINVKFATKLDAISNVNSRDKVTGHGSPSLKSSGSQLWFAPNMVPLETILIFGCNYCVVIRLPYLFPKERAEPPNTFIKAN